LNTRHICDAEWLYENLKRKKQMTKDELKVILEKHKLWLEGNKEGVRADLSGVNLIGANLEDANLEGAYLGGADLTGAKLDGAIMQDSVWRKNMFSEGETK
jgi:uncharacterized protein YjbI with pentapeptide repeats